MNLTYGYVYWDTLAYFDLNPTQVLLMILIAGLSQGNKQCYASQNYLAERLNVTIPTIRKAIEDLEVLGLLNRKGKSPMGTNRLKPHVEWTRRVEEVQLAIHAEEMKKSAEKRDKALYL